VIVFEKALEQRLFLPGGIPAPVEEPAADGGDR